MTRPFPSRRASIPTMIRPALMGLALIALLTGCGPKNEPLAPVKDAANGTSSQAADPSDQGIGQNVAPNDAARQIEEFAKPNEALHKIDRPDETKWSPAKPTAAPVKKGLGAIIDEGFANLEPAFVNVRIQCLDRGSTMNMNPQLKIQSQEKFNIQYGLPETESWINSAVANGQRRIMLTKGKQKDLGAFKADRHAPPMNLDQIQDFIERMPIAGFSSFTNDVAPWDGFVRGLQDPKNGFNVKISEQEAAPVGEERPFYRLVAKRPGSRAMEVEIIVDSKRNVPVTFRGHITYKDKKTRKLVWQAAWSFGGEFEPQDFRIPGSNE